MPELPEVETIRRGLARTIVGKRIAAIEIRKARLIRGPITAFRKRLIGQSVRKVERRGKLLAFTLQPSGRYLLIHLKMTGQLIYQLPDQLVVGGHSSLRIQKLPHKYSYIIFHFTDSSTLYFNDQRQFGYAQLVDSQHKQEVWKRYGPEPLSTAFTSQRFKQGLMHRTTLLKAALLNQNIVAGIGNLYVDEICWHARVRPTRRVNTLTTRELKALYTHTKAVLQTAVRYRGTTFSDYRDALGKQGRYRQQLAVYGRDRLPCLRCETPIRKIKGAGRGTHFCPICQH